TPFPYTTLFRSELVEIGARVRALLDLDHLAILEHAEAVAAGHQHDAIALAQFPLRDDGPALVEERHLDAPPHDEQRLVGVLDGSLRGLGCAGRSRIPGAGASRRAGATGRRS